MKGGSVASVTGAMPVVLRTVACGVLFDALIPLSPFVIKSLGATGPEFQRTLSIGFFLFSAVQFLAPRFAVHGGIERLLILSTLAVAGLCGLLAFSSTFLGFSFVLLLMFSVNALGSIAARASLRGLLDTQNFEKATSLGYFLMAAAAIVAPFFIVAVSTKLHWKWLVILPAVFLCVICLFLPRNSAFRREHTFSHAGSGFRGSEFSRILRRRGFHVPLLMGMAAQGLFSSAMISKPFILVDHFGLATSELGPLLASIAMGEVLGFYFSGKAAGRFSWQHRMCAALLFQSMASLAILAAVFVPSVSLFLAFVGFAVIFFCIVFPLSAAMALDVPLDERVHASALYGGVQSLGGALIVFLLSWAAVSPVVGLAILSILVFLVVSALQYALHR